MKTEIILPCQLPDAHAEIVLPPPESIFNIIVGIVLEAFVKAVLVGLAAGCFAYSLSVFTGGLS